MHNSFDLFVKIRAKDLNQMRDIVEYKIRKLLYIVQTELMRILKTRKKERKNNCAVKKLFLSVV